MNKLAEALALATAYIASRQPHDDDEEDEDVAVLEAIAASLQSASPAEVKALSESADMLAKQQTDPIFKDTLVNLLPHLGLAE
jgi:hypothetical protein